MPEFDQRARVLDDPAPGYWLVRCCPTCPWVPAAIIRHELRHEPGVPDNDMRGTRSPFLGAYISGQPVGLGEVWMRRGRDISRVAYEQLLVEIRTNLRANRYEPRAAPRTPVKLEQIPIPFARRAR